MSDYRRLYIPGGWYFFTLVTHQRRPYLTATAWPQLKLAFRSAALRMPYRMPAIVVLPDHLHCIWSLPAGDAEHSRRWQFIKASFARRQRYCGAASETPLWQARYWEHWLRDEADVRKHLDFTTTRSNTGMCHALQIGASARSDGMSSEGSIHRIGVRWSRRSSVAWMSSDGGRSGCGCRARGFAAEPGLRTQQ